MWYDFRHLTTINTLEKKQKAFDKIVNEWKKKTDDIQREVDATIRDSRNTSTEVTSSRKKTKGLENWLTIRHCFQTA